MSSSRSSYQPQKYWEALLKSKYNASGVGHRTLSNSFNRIRYLREMQNIEDVLDRYGVRPGRVLDVGSGTGIWIEFWKRRGVHEIVGLDITETAVQRLRANHPDCQILQSDVGDEDLPVSGGFDAISAMSVLLHITDDSRFRRALHSLVEMLAPEGVLLLVEPVVVHRWWGRPFHDGSHSKARPLSTYESALAEVGAEIIELRANTYLLDNPADARSRAAFYGMSLYWHILQAIVGQRERVGAMVGGLLGRADQALVARARPGPSSKVVVIRRLERPAV